MMLPHRKSAASGPGCQRIEPDTGTRPRGADRLLPHPPADRGLGCRIHQRRTALPQQADTADRPVRVMVQQRADRTARHRRHRGRRIARDHHHLRAVGRGQRRPPGRQRFDNPEKIHFGYQPIAADAGPRPHAGSEHRAVERPAGRGEHLIGGGPPPVRVERSAMTSASLRSTPITRCPSARSWRVVCRPIPDADPVIA